MENFTPVSGAIGGALIGLSAALFILVNGRVAGISSILGGLWDNKQEDMGWRLAFLAGLFLGPYLVALFLGGFPKVDLQASTDTLVLAGVLVGVGTGLGAGCTSGHGVCGVSRGSVRSIVATIVFIVVAMATVYVKRHVLGG